MLSEAEYIILLKAMGIDATKDMILRTLDGYRSYEGVYFSRLNRHGVYFTIRRSLNNLDDLDMSLWADAPAEETRSGDSIKDFYKIRPMAGKEAAALIHLIELLRGVYR